MNAYKGGKKYLALIAALLMAVTAFAVVAAADDSEADDVAVKSVSDSGFKQDAKGTLTVNLSNIGGDMYVIVKVKEGSHTLANSKEYLDSANPVVKLKFELSEGKHTVEISVWNEDETTEYSIPYTYTIDVDKNIWSNVTTYLAIILIVVIVIIIAVVYMRQVPKKKPTTTFTQLEAEKKAAEQASASESSEETAAPKTEKKKYGGSSENKETGKIKYTSSRRK